MGKKTKAVTIKKGENDYVLDPRQSLFFTLYSDPKSPTFGNALQSGIEAGFSKEYSENIMSLMPTWLSEKLGEISPMLAKAERNLEEFLDLDVKVPAMGAFGPIMEKKEDGTKVAVMKTSTEMLKVKADISKFVAERIGKKKYGSDTPPVPPGGNVNIMNIVINPPKQDA